MCDPLSIGALAIGAAGTAANSIGQMKAAKKQEEAYNAWANKQQQNRIAENARQETQRKVAEGSRQQGVEDLSIENQKKLQSAEEKSLKAELLDEDPNAPASAPPTAVADAALSGSDYGGQVFQTDLAKQLADATASAKDRIGALATVQSYGGSEGGLDTVNPHNLMTAGSGIDAANFKRRGSLGAYEAEQAVDPLQITYSNPVADIASQFLGVGMQGVGKTAAGGTGGSLGGMFGGALYPNAPTAPQFIGPTMPLPAAYAKTQTIF